MLSYNNYIFNDLNTIIDTSFKKFENNPKEMEDYLNNKIKKFTNLVEENPNHIMLNINEFLNLKEIFNIELLNNLKNIIPEILNEKILYSDLSIKEQKILINITKSILFLKSLKKYENLVQNIKEYFQKDNIKNIFKQKENLKKELKNITEKNKHLINFKFLNDEIKINNIQSQEIS